MRERDAVLVRTPTVERWAHAAGPGPARAMHRVVSVSAVAVKFTLMVTASAPELPGTVSLLSFASNYKANEVERT